MFILFFYGFIALNGLFWSYVEPAQSTEIVDSFASKPVKTDYVEAQLVTTHESIRPGESFYVALRLKMAEHWHTYWKNPGDSGLPTTIQWELPTGFVAGPILWPIPQKIPLPPLANYGYEDEVLLPALLQVPTSTDQTRPITLKARADWLVCKDVCLPDGADLTLTLPWANSTLPPQTTRWEREIQQTLAQLPQLLSNANFAPIRSPQAWRTLATGPVTLILPSAAIKQPLQTLAFFPNHPGKLQAIAPQDSAAYQTGWTLTLEPAQEPQGSWDEIDGILVGYGGYGDQKNRPLWAYEIKMPINTAPIAEIAAQKGKWLGTALPSSTVTPSTATPNIASNTASFGAWLIALIGAFIGGLILNLMPCVFPILSLKILHFAQSEDHSQKHRWQHAAAYLAGVLTCFLSLAILVLSLRNAGELVGWGFQLQEPRIIVGLAFLFFALALNLCGVYEILLPARWLNFWPSATVSTANSPSNVNTRGALWHAFASGILAVIVASPCTAPFMGAAIGFAITQSYGYALSIFAALGIGMALPYIILVSSPRLLNWLPRPGMWMQRLKTFLAFPLFATVVWLAWVLGMAQDIDAIARLGFALTLFSLGLWLWGEQQRGSKRLGWLAWPMLAFALFTAIPLGQKSTGSLVTPDSGNASSSTSPTPTYQAFSPAAVTSALAQGQTVFVDFTAAWCITCQANKKLVLEKPSIIAAFQAKKIATFRADWTKRDPIITESLQQLGRSGVPVYVFYQPQKPPVLLPEILTESIVLQALAEVK